MSNSAKTQIFEILDNLDPDTLQLYLMEAGQRIGEIKDKGHVQDHQQLIFTHGEMMQVAALLKVQ
jgi:hypothetical protein